MLGIGELYAKAVVISGLCLEPGADGPQQERRKVRVIGRLRRRIARQRGCFGAADRGRARGGRSNRRREGSGWRLGLVGGIAAAARASGFAFTSGLAAASRTFS